MNALTKYIWSLLGGLFPVTATRIAYFKAKRTPLHLGTPQLFDEKLEYLKLFQYANDPLVARCSDKYAVREFVAKRGCDRFLNELYGVWNSPDEISFETLPDKFALKCTHGCHMNIICADKAQIDIIATKKQLAKWLTEKQWKIQQELHYRLIRPQIICEKYLVSGWGGELPEDYKIYCFNGEPKLVLLTTNRNPHDETQVELTFRDVDWNHLDIGNRKSNLDIPAPSCLPDMLQCARLLSAGFPFVRVDFYDIGGKAIFGEMTFTPAGANADYYTVDGQKMLGRMLDIS